MLLFLGTLTAIRSPTLTEQNSTIFLTWGAPSTLDILNVDPDIEGYYVKTKKSSSTSSLLQTLDTEFVNETRYSYPTPHDGACCTYMFAITPVNVVGNGTQTTVYYRRTDTRMLFSVSLNREIMIVLTSCSP